MRAVLLYAVGNAAGQAFGAIGEPSGVMRVSGNQHLGSTGKRRILRPPARDGAGDGFGTVGVASRHRLGTAGKCPTSRG